MTRISPDKGGHNDIFRVTEHPPAPAPTRRRPTDPHTQGNTAALAGQPESAPADLTAYKAVQWLAGWYQGRREVQDA